LNLTGFLLASICDNVIGMMDEPQKSMLIFSFNQYTCQSPRPDSKLGNIDETPAHGICWIVLTNRNNGRSRKKLSLMVQDSAPKKSSLSLEFVS